MTNCKSYLLIILLCVLSVRTQGNRQGLNVGIIISIIIAGILIILLIVYICCVYSRWVCCPPSTYKEFKRIRKSAKHSPLLSQQFIEKRNIIIQLINNSRHEKHNFKIMQNQVSFTVQAVAKIIKEQQKQLITEIRIVGDDAMGIWWADGYILNKEEGICLWFCKIYDDSKKFGRWDHLIFQSTDINLERLEIQGIFYSKRFQSDYSWRGTWKLSKDGQMQNFCIQENLNVIQRPNFKVISSSLNFGSNINQQI